PAVALTVLAAEDWYRQITLLGRVVSIEDDPDLEGIDRLAIRYGDEPVPPTPRPPRGGGAVPPAPRPPRQCLDADGAVVRLASSSLSEDPQCACSFVAEDPSAGGLVARLDDYLVYVHVPRPGQCEDDAVGDVLGAQRIDAPVDRGRPLLVALEAHERELRLGQSGVDRGDPDRAA